jgi:hypothetical protein
MALGLVLQPAAHRMAGRIDWLDDRPMRPALAHAALAALKAD